MLASGLLPGETLVGGCWFAYFTNGGIDDGVEELTVIGVRFGLDVFACAPACLGVVGKGEAASLGRDFGELLNDVEEGGLIPACELPAIGDRAGQNLLGGPVMGSSGVGRRSDGDRRLRLLLLRIRSKGCGGEGDADGDSIG